MKKIGAKWIVLFALLLCSLAHAQFKLLPVTNNDLRNNLSKVISDFPTGLSSIKGDVLVENPQSTEYESTLKFEGAESNSITKYAAAKPIYSWQATLLTTEDYETAAKKYKWLCGQLKVITVKMDNGVTFSLDGVYEQPEESKKFSTSTYRLMPAANNMPKLKIEATMQFEFPEWKVNLLVYQKEREDNERGQTEE